MLFVCHTDSQGLDLSIILSFSFFVFFDSNSVEATYFQASYISSLHLIQLVSLLDFSIVNHNTGSPTLQLSSLSISLNFLKFHLLCPRFSLFHSSASSFSSCILIHLSLSPLVLGYSLLVFPLLGQFGKKGFDLHITFLH